MAASKLDTLKGLIREFEKVQAKYAKRGAQDTEPDGVFHFILVGTAKGKTVRVPTTVEGWELYSGADSEQAARDLAEAAQKCVDLLKTVTLAESEAVRKCLADYCWRCDW